MRIDEINARLEEISSLIENASPEELNGFETEIRSLTDERDSIRSAAERRQSLRARIGFGGGQVIDSSPAESAAPEADECASPEYRSAWLRAMQGRSISSREQSLLSAHAIRSGMTSANASAGYTIPTITADMIIANLAQEGSLLGAIDMLNIPGNVTIPVEKTVGNAAIHTENAELSASEDVIDKISLGAYDICKLISISANLSVMSIGAFESWIVSNLTRKLRGAMENYVINGTGSSQPKGIEYADTWVDGTNAVDWASTAPTAAEVQEAIGVLNGAYAANAAWLMSFNTFWVKIHVLRDANNPAIVTGDNRNGFRIFGFPVIFSDKVAADTAYFGDFREGVKANLAQGVEIAASAESGFTRHSTDFRGSVLFDCAPVKGRFIKFAASL